MSHITRIRITQVSITKAEHGNDSCPRNLYNQLIRISHVKMREPGVKTTESELR